MMRRGQKSSNQAEKPADHKHEQQRQEYKDNEKVLPSQDLPQGGMGDENPTRWLKNSLGMIDPVASGMGLDGVAVRSKSAPLVPQEENKTGLSITGLNARRISEPEGSRMVAASMEAGHKMKQPGYREKGEVTPGTLEDSNEPAATSLKFAASGRLTEEEFVEVQSKAVHSGKRGTSRHAFASGGAEFTTTAAVAHVKFGREEANHKSRAIGPGLQNTKQAEPETTNMTEGMPWAAAVNNVMLGLEEADGSHMSQWGSHVKGSGTLESMGQAQNEVSSMNMPFQPARNLRMANQWPETLDATHQEKLPAKAKGRMAGKVAEPVQQIRQDPRGDVQPIQQPGAKDGAISMGLAAEGSLGANRSRQGQRSQQVQVAQQPTFLGNHASMFLPKANSALGTGKGIPDQVSTEHSIGTGRGVPSASMGSTGDSFYATPRNAFPSAFGGMVQHPQAVQPFAPVHEQFVQQPFTRQFGQFPGNIDFTTYLQTGMQQPDWKHTPMSSAVNMDSETGYNSNFGQQGGGAFSASPTVSPFLMPGMFPGAALNFGMVHGTNFMSRGPGVPTTQNPPLPSTPPPGFSSVQPTHDLPAQFPEELGIGDAPSMVGQGVGNLTAKLGVPAAHPGTYFTGRGAPRGGNNRFSRSGGRGPLVEGGKSDEDGGRGGRGGRGRGRGRGRYGR